MDDLLREYRINNRKSIDDAETRWKLHLKPAFAHIRASDLCRTDAVERYIESRQKEGAANATINREMSLLKRAFNLARKGNGKKVREIPIFPHLKEAPPRKGFLEDSAYRKLVDGSPVWFRVVVEVGRKFAWRVSEVLNLRVEQIDLFGRTIRLHAGETKNDEARTVPIPDSLYSPLVECVRGKQPEGYVFTRSTGNPFGIFVGTGGELAFEPALAASSAPLANGHLMAGAARNVRHDLVTRDCCFMICAAPALGTCGVPVLPKA
jgi:integrase